MKDEGCRVVYLNFPIILLSGFMNDSGKVFYEIIAYAFYRKTLDIDGLSINRKLDYARSYFGLDKSDKEIEVFELGRDLYNSIHLQTPMTGISIHVFFDFVQNQKSKDDKIILLAHLALKSIIMYKPYQKVTNKYWFSRMDGKAKSITEMNELSEDVLYYATEYRIKKIKQELILNWGLVYYSRHTRGFHISYSLKLEDLILHVEKKRKSRLLKSKKQQEKEAVNRVLARME